MANEGEDRTAVRDRFVNALTIFLQASRTDVATTGQRSALAQSRGLARRMLSTAEYDEAVFQAFREAGIEF
jgi:hypothetical protein